MKEKLIKNLHLITLAVVVIFAGGIRFYKLAEVPASLSWDEVANGYNAWSVLNWGVDEWGNKFPLVFKSFEDYKHPLHIYLTIPSILVFGLTEWGVRASAAFFGVLNVIVIYFLASKIAKSRLIGLVAAFVLALSPYAVHFSRFNHELNFVVFFFMLGVYLILEGSARKNILLTLGFGSLGLTLLGYHSAKVVVPPIFLLLITLYLKDFWRAKKFFIGGILLFFLFVSLLLIEPQLLGTARFKQTKVSDKVLMETYLYQKTNNLLLGRIEDMAGKYKTHFTYDFLLAKGDPNPRLSSQYKGMYYLPDAILLLAGVATLLVGIVKAKNRDYLLILVWALLAPIPASISEEVPHAGRAMFMVGSWHIVVALGVLGLFYVVRNKYFRAVVVSVYFLWSSYSFYGFANHYLNEYTTRYAIDWQYGMKEIAAFVKAHPEYDEVFTTPERQQPYIFYLFYLKTPLPSFLGTVSYNTTQSRPANTVSGYGRYRFGGWNPIESLPRPNVLYVLTPFQYSGLRHKLSFDTVLEVKYPNGGDAFYLVAVKR